MNHIYRVVYNSATNTYQAVPENSTGKHKTDSEKSSCAVSDVSEKGAFFSLKPMALCAMAMGLSSTGAWAAPTGGHISAGDASISQHGKITNIQQNSQKAAINWQTFGIKADETVNFKQPNAQAVILNRVIGNEKSVIDGAMNANGKVFISNPNGMIFGKNAQINVGALLATTAKIKDQDFMNGFFKFDEATGDITHLGDIKVPTGGVVALIAPIVENKGKITAPQGKVLLASAEQFSITLPDNGQFAYTLDRGTLQGLVDNGGAILADGGHVILTAKGTDAVKKSLIKHTGKIEANTVQNKNGVIELLGDLDNSRLEVSGSLKAEAKENGDGGFIETSAADVKIQETAQISTKAENGNSGKWLLDPNDLIVGAGGTMTGGQVETALQNNGDFELKSTNGKADGKGDVIINDEISWNKGKLTLNAQNDIHINKTLNGTGTAKLALEYGQGTTNGGQSDYYLDKNTPLKDRTVKVNLPEGKNFSTKKGSNGQIVEFDVIHTMPEISSDGKAKDFDIQNIAFGKDMDLSYTENHNGFAGWGLKKKYQSGSDLLGGEKIHGLGHTVQNLTLDAPNQDIVGLFRKAEKAELRDLNLRNAKVKGQHYIGTLAGSLINSQVSNIHVNRSSILGAHNIGGIVGYVENNSGTNSQITNLHSNVKINASEGRSVGGAIGTVSGSGYEPTLTNINDVTATGEIRVAGGGDVVGGTGGLIGTLNLSSAGNKEDKIFVSNSSATGNVIAPNARGVGGFIGHIQNYGDKQIVVQNSFATGNVEGYYETGGFIGATEKSTIANNYATGNVSGSSSGGLVGRLSRATIQNSYATGNLKATNSNNVLGGLVGYADQSQIKRSYATGNITADGKNITSANSVTAGGLVGNNWDSDISESYATGNIHGTDFELTAGGLVGKHSGGSNIENSYATGDVSGLGWRLFLGGLIGNVGDRESTVSNTYATGKLTAPDEKNTYYQPNGLVGSHNYDNTKPLAGVSDSYFNKETVGTDKDFAGGKALTTAEMQNKASFANWDFDDIWYINDGEIPKLHAHKKGTISINPVVTPPITQPSNPTNNKTDLGIQANNLNKVYDGKSVATESDLRAIATQNGYTDIVTISGLKNGDSVSKLGTLRYDGTGNTWQNAKNAGSYTIMPSGLTGGQDYEIKYGEGKLTIDKRPVEAILRGQKTYNTHNQAEIDGQTRFNQNGLIDDTVKFTGSVTLAGKDAGNHNIVDSSKVQITGDGAENYELKSVTGIWKINPQSVDATAIGSKVYDDSAVANIDDTTRVSFSRNAEGVYESDLDKVKLSGSVILKGKDVGAHTIQDFNNATLTGEAAKNYTLKNLVGRWNITPAPVVITGKSLTLKGKREYDATNNAYAKDVDMQSLNEQLYDSDKGKIKIEGIGKLEDIHVGEQALKDKNTLALTGDAAKNYEIQVSGSKWEITPYTFSLRGNKTYDATTYADAKDVDQRYLDVFLFPNDKGKIQLKGTGSIVATNATSLDKPHKLADKGSLRLTSNTDPNLAKNYQINFDDSGWTVEKRKITATGEKVYNADNRIDAKDLKPSDVDMAPDDRNKGADALHIASGTALLNTKHVHQNGSRITETGTLKLSGSLADNYELTSGGYVKIQPAVLTVKAVSDTKTYDGTTVSNKTPIVSGLQGADKLIEAKQEFLDKDVLGEGKSRLHVSGKVKIEDGNDGNNYRQPTIPHFANGTITPKKLTITAMNNIKPEGENNPDVSRIGVTVQGLIDGESISDVNLSYSDDKKWQGEVSVIRVGEPVFKNGKASNYAITKKDGKLLTVQKEYDVKNIENKPADEVARYRDLLNAVEDEMLLANAVYGSDTAKKGDNDRFYEVWEVTDNQTKHTIKEINPDLSNPNKTYKKLFQLVGVVDYSEGLLKGLVDDFRDGTYYSVAPDGTKLPNGLAAGIYQNLKENDKYYIVFRGTDTAKPLNPLNLGLDSDWGTNLVQGTGGLPPQYQKAAEIVKDLVTKYPDRDYTVVGHSLGGGLATYSTSQLVDSHKIKTIVFNPAQLHVNNILGANEYLKYDLKYYTDDYRKKLDLYSQSSRFDNINSYVIDNDLLKIGDMISSAYMGNKKDVELLSHYQGISPNIIGEMSNDHLMSHVIKTQKLADIMAKNNEILANCQNNCVKFQEHQWIPSGSNGGNTAHVNSNTTGNSATGNSATGKPNIDNSTVDTTNKLAYTNSNEQNKVHQEIAERIKRGREKERQQHDLKQVTEQLNKVSGIEVTVGSITVMRGTDMFTLNPTHSWQFKKGDIISTGNQKAIINFPDGSWLELDKGTSIEFTIDYDPNIQLDRLIANHILLIKGNILKKGSN